MATPFHNVNREKIVSYLESGCGCSCEVGLEVEHIVLRRDGQCVGYSQPGGVRDVLEHMSSRYDEVVREDGRIVSMARAGVRVSVGASGQIAVALDPSADVVDLERSYLGFRNDLDAALDEFGLEVPMLGYNPSACAAELEPVPRYRYECFARFFGADSPEVANMMRGTASLRASIRYGSEADAVRKLRIAETIAPILSFICDNSPIYEKVEQESNVARIVTRSKMDGGYAGMVPGSLEPSFSFSDYADYILAREAVLVPDAAQPSGWRYVGGTTFDEVYADRAMTDAEVEHALAMVWPDVRLDRAIEICAADAMPLEYCLAYAVLLRALFCSRRNLDVLESLFGSVDEDQVDQARASLVERGYGAHIYGRPVEFWADLLVVLAQGSLNPGEGFYFEPIDSMVRHRFTLAEIWPRLMEKRTEMPAGSFDAPIIGVVPRYDFEWTGLAVSDGYLGGLLEVGGVPIVLPATADPAHIARLVSRCDGFLIPGGQDIDPGRYGCRREPHTHRSATARDAMEDALVRAVVEADKPLLGICRGMQSLNVALGGTLHQDIREDNPSSDLVHVQGRPFTMPAHMVELVEDSLLAECVGATRLGVNTIHHQCVAELGEGLVVNAVSPTDGVIEGIEMPGKRFVVGVQWHPEHMWRERPHSKRLFRAFVDAARSSKSPSA